jgi:hypothetical protein
VVGDKTAASAVHDMFMYVVEPCTGWHIQPLEIREIETMRIQILATLATTTLASLALAAAPASAKTVKQCQSEWRADKTAMQAAGKTEKAYVAECHPAAAKPAAAAAAAPKAPKEDKGAY